MNNIWTIFKTDLKHLGVNAISWVVVVGLIVIPSLYAWFCIYAFWDPYNHTEHLKVAVASVDSGYESSLLPVEINIGKEVVSELHENRQMNWVFVNRKEAVEGVRSGKYYAALVIPGDFSRNLLSILSDDVRSAEILYYINEKENAIAAKVSNQGASTIQHTIDEMVAETASGLLMNSLDAVSGVINDEGTEALTEHLRKKLEELSGGLNTSAGTLDNLYSMNQTLDSLLKTTDDLLSEMGADTSASVQELESMGSSFDSLESDLNVMNEKMDNAFQNTQQSYNTIHDATVQYLQNMDTDARTVSSSLNTLADRVLNIAGRYQDLQNNVQNLSDSLPSELNASRAVLNQISVELDRSVRQQMQVYESLSDASANITGVSSDAIRYEGELAGYISRCSQDMQRLRDSFRNDVQPQMISLADSLSQTEESVRMVTDNLKTTSAGMKDTATSVSGQMDQLNQNLLSTRDLLKDAADKIQSIRDQMDQDDGTGTRDILRKLMENDNNAVSGYVSSIVKLNSHIIYPVENFGAAMTPFYTSLAIWVGAVVLVAMLQVEISEKMRARLKNAKNWQIYLGRYGVFLLISLLQSLLIAVGDLAFLGVQCVHPVRFILTCLYAGFVFVTLVYTLTASFGNIGKAIAVILMVFQVAGSGGTIPIEMTPSFFHIFYPLLPLTHSMTALRECIAGMYGNDYYVQLGILSIYVWISLLLGLILRNPMINLNHRLVEKLESTKVM